jgi:hypothetical protein
MSGGLTIGLDENDSLLLEGVRKGEPEEGGVILRGAVLSMQPTGPAARAPSAVTAA